MAAQPLLDMRGVETFYGNIRALNGVDIAVIGARFSPALIQRLNGTTTMRVRKPAVVAKPARPRSFSAWTNGQNTHGKQS